VKPRIAIAGAAGRTGRRLVVAAAADRTVRLAAALESQDSAELGRDAGTVAGIDALALPLRADAPEDFDVLVDFSTPAGTGRWLEVCVERRVPIAIGTTGHGAAQLDRIQRAAESIAVVLAPNMSVGANVLARLVREAARMLAGADVEIVETHHRGKRDAPSGTAWLLRDAVVAGRGAESRTVHGRRREDGPRTAGEIGIHSVRLGGDPGGHAVHLGAPEEIVTLAHRAVSRDAYAAGALRAARWLAGRAAGFYGMEDVLS